MRKIKFRAKRFGDEEWWCYGEPHIESTFHPHIHEGFNRKSRINPSTLCQFTGKIDENGNEIYEGDIIEANYKHSELGENYGIIPDQDCICQGEVIWDNGTFAYLLRITHTDDSTVIEQGCDYLLGDFDLECAKVLGNIYDNLELIED